MVKDTNDNVCSVNNDSVHREGSFALSGANDSQGGIRSGGGGHGIHPTQGVHSSPQSQSMVASATVTTPVNLPPPDTSMAENKSPHLPLPSVPLVDKQPKTKTAASVSPSPPNTSLTEDKSPQLPLPSVPSVDIPTTTQAAASYSLSPPGASLGAHLLPLLMF